MLEAGAMVAGKLRVERVLGQGGMGTVVIATHVGLDQRVALKVLHAELSHNPEVVARFVREARASARLKSEHVCRVSDVGQLETGEPYIEMELLDGSDLSKLIEQAPLPIETAADYVVQACVAVAEAHQLGIIHRDLKPANLFVTRRLDGSALVKVLDFGIATAPTSNDLQITKTTTIMGSPGYMSPEHLRSARDVDARSDIWALGVILYEAVTARLPFVATTITELAVKVVMDDPEPLTGVDPRYAAIVARCLAKPPDQRYQTVAELAADLAPIAGAGAEANAMLVARLLTGSAQLPAVSAQLATAKASAELAVAAKAATRPPAALGHETTLHGAAGSSTMPAPRKRSPALIAGLATVVLVGGAGGAWLVMRGGKPEVAPIRDAAAAVAVADDAAVPATSVVDATDQNVARLQKLIPELAAQKDWSAILTISDGVTDPLIAPLVADAKQKFVAEELDDIRGYTKRGDCASAKLAATNAAKLAPDRAAELDKAAACVAKPKPPVATPLDLANAAYDNAKYADALKLAEQAVAADPKNLDALRLAARAACGAQNADKAHTYIAKLAVPDRKLPTSVCRMMNVDLGLPTTPTMPTTAGTKPTTPTMPTTAGTKPTTPTTPTTPLESRADVAKELAFAKTAFQDHNWPNAMTSAQKVLAIEPNSIEAMRILGVSACRVGRFDIAKAVLAKRLPRGAAGAIHRQCGSAVD